MSEIKLFNKYELENIKITDPGLERYINLKPVIIPKTSGRLTQQQFHKSQMNIVERLINALYVSGHRGKRHRITSKHLVGKYTKALKVVKETFNILESKTKKNPVEVLVRALENAALREEITSFQVGGIIVRRAVITAPQRRIDLALRYITQAAYQAAFGKPKPMAQTLAEELLAAYNNDSQNSRAIKTKERIEREAGGAR